MAVHVKWGRENSLAWVTHLASGKPVAGAEIRVTASCTGRLLASGTADEAGRLAFPKGLPEPETYSSCEDDPHPMDSERHALLVTARAGDAFNFPPTAPGKGHRPNTPAPPQ